MKFRLRVSMWIALAAVMVAQAGQVRADQALLDQYGKSFTQETMKPAGEHYEAEVPDTLDLAEHGRLATQGLINFLDPERDYMQYQIAFFNTNPPYMSHYGMEDSNKGKLSESLLKMRAISGSDALLPEQEAMFRGILRRMTPEGLFYNDLSKGPWAESIKTDDQLPVNTSRMMIAFVTLYEQTGDPKLKELIEHMGQGIYGLAHFEGESAWFSAVPPEQFNSDIGVLGYWQNMFYHGTSTRALSTAYMLTGDKQFLNLAQHLRHLLLMPKYWVPEAAPKVVVPAENAQFQGHHHSYCATFMGLLKLAEATQDSQLMEFVRKGYEYLRTFGLSRIGLYGEVCTTGDMTWLAAKLSQLGVGDYYDDVDCYVRNQLVEQHITDPERLQAAINQMPKLDKMYEPKYAEASGYTTESMVQKNLGVWLSDASNPALVRPQTFRWTICCSGNAPPGLYAAWDSILLEKGNVAQVNLLLNRAGRLLDIDSYLPYEGRVVLHNKQAETVELRMPLWVELGKVEVTIDGKPHEAVWHGRYTTLTGLRPKSEIEFRFPVSERDETYTLMWKKDDMWPESTNPGNSWKAEEPPARYTLHMRGNTVIDVSPRPKGPGLELYRREAMRGDKAPLVKRTRFVAARHIDW